MKQTAAERIFLYALVISDGMSHFHHIFLFMLEMIGKIHSLPKEKVLFYYLFLIFNLFYFYIYYFIFIFIFILFFTYLYLAVACGGLMWDLLMWAAKVKALNPNCYSNRELPKDYF